jgi:hypothetical protein
MGARESIPIRIFLHPSSSHDVPKEHRDQARRRETIEAEGSELMRTQVTHGDQEDRPHPLRRACPDQGNRISLPRQGGEGLYSRS